MGEYILRVVELYNPVDIVNQTDLVEQPHEGMRNLFGEEDDFYTWLLGAEHTLYNVFDSSISMTVLAEWVYDERGSAASNVWTNDLFISCFPSFNEIAVTELTVGLLSDLEYDHRALNVEFKRRLSDSWVIRLECSLNLKSDPVDVTYDGRRGSLLGIDLNFNF